MKPRGFIKRLEKSIPSKMVASWLESVHSPNRELCQRLAVELLERSGNSDESAAVRYFAAQSARDAFVLHFISGPLTSVLVFFFDVHRTERHLSNLAGTVILMHDPDKNIVEWREQSLNYLAGVSEDASRFKRARKLFRRMMIRNGAQTLATQTLKRTIAPKGIVGHLTMCGAHALWSYGEVVMAASDRTKQHLSSLVPVAVAHSA